jgi:hypothetical protein
VYYEIMMFIMDYGTWPVLVPNVTPQIQFKQAKILNISSTEVCPVLKYSYDSNKICKCTAAMGVPIPSFHGDDIHSFFLFFNRRMLKIPWVYRVSNKEVLKRAQEKRVLWNNTVKRRDRLIGHLLRHEGLLKTVTEGTVAGKRCRGRPRLSFIQQIVSDVTCKNYTEIKRLTDSRREWRAASNRSTDRKR